MRVNLAWPSIAHPLVMENNIKKSFALNIIVLKIAGVYRSTKYTHLFKLFSYMLYAFAMLPTIVFGFIQLFCNINFLHNDLAGVVIFFQSPKIWLIVKNGHKIKRCIHYFDNELVTSVNDGHDEIIDKCDKICRRNSLVYFISCNICALSWFIQLFLREDISELPLDVWNPFEVNDRSMFYYSLYVSLVLGMFSFIFYVFAKTNFQEFIT
jgi:hypothetical protein